MEVTCPSCGAENYESARYCRKCGFQLGSAEFHEATTRSLDEQRRVEPVVEPVQGRGFDTFGSAPLGNEPARYIPPPVAPQGALQPGMTHMPGRVNTSPMNTGPVNKGTNVFLIVACILLTMFVGGVITVAVVASKFRHRDTPPSTAGPTVPGKSKPPPGRTKSDSGSVDPDSLPEAMQPWYYDGAELNTFQRSESSGVLIMTTNDDAGEVADYYRDKFKKITREVHEQDNVILTGDADQKVTVVISGDEEGDADEDKTNIVVSIGNDFGIPGLDGFPFGPGAAPPAAPPPPPAIPPTPPAPGSTAPKAPKEATKP